MQLHVFVDPSQRVYAAAAYVRGSINLNMETKLIYANSRLFPVKGLTISQLNSCVDRSSCFYLVDREKELKNYQRLFGAIQCVYFIDKKAKVIQRRKSV